MKEAREEEYGDAYFGSVRSQEPGYDAYLTNAQMIERRTRRNSEAAGSIPMPSAAPKLSAPSIGSIFKKNKKEADSIKESSACADEAFFDFEEQHESKLEERMKHMHEAFLYVMATRKNFWRSFFMVVSKKCKRFIENAP